MRANGYRSAKINVPDIEMKVSNECMNYMYDNDDDDEDDAWNFHFERARSTFYIETRVYCRRYVYRQIFI